MSLKIQALRAKYEAQRIEALATLEIYVKGSVGIGEHSGIIDEMDKLVRIVADADSYLETISRVFVSNVEGTATEERVNS